MRQGKKQNRHINLCLPERGEHCKLRGLRCIVNNGVRDDVSYNEMNM